MSEENNKDNGGTGTQKPRSFGRTVKKWGIVGLTSVFGLTVALPIATRGAFVAITSSSQECVINKEDPISTKPYKASTLQQFGYWPAGFLLGGPGGMLDQTFNIYSSTQNRYMLHATCDDGNGARVGKAFEITDSWWRSDKKFRSSDLATELSSISGEPVTINAFGIRWGKVSWNENVASYVFQGQKNKIPSSFTPNAIQPE